MSVLGDVPAGELVSIAGQLRIVCINHRDGDSVLVVGHQRDKYGDRSMTENMPANTPCEVVPLVAYLYGGANGTT